MSGCHVDRSPTVVSGQVALGSGLEQHQSTAIAIANPRSDVQRRLPQLAPCFNNQHTIITQPLSDRINQIIIELIQCDEDKKTRSSNSRNKNEEPLRFIDSLHLANGLSCVSQLEINDGSFKSISETLISTQNILTNIIKICSEVLPYKAKLKK